MPTTKDGTTSTVKPDALIRWIIMGSTMVVFAVPTILMTKNMVNKVLRIFLIILSLIIGALFGFFLAAKRYQYSLTQSTSSTNVKAAGTYKN